MPRKTVCLNIRSTRPTSGSRLSTLSDFRRRWLCDSKFERSNDGAERMWSTFELRSRGRTSRVEGTNNRRRTGESQGSSNSNRWYEHLFLVEQHFCGSVRVGESGKMSGRCCFSGCSIVSVVGSSTPNSTPADSFCETSSHSHLATPI